MKMNYYMPIPIKSTKGSVLNEKDLKMQVMYNGLTLLMDLVIGFAFAKLYKFRSWLK